MPLTPVFALPGTIEFSGENDDFYNADHLEAMEVERGVLALTFSPNDISGRNTLFSKDGRDYDDGGHLTAWINDGALEVRQQSDDESETLKTDGLTISKGETYHLAVSFGSKGLKVYLNGSLILAEPEMRQGLAENMREFLVGASGSHRSNDGEFPRDPFNGTISNLELYDVQLSPERIAGLAGDALGMHAEMHALNKIAMEELAPAFAQLHHGSDAAMDLATQYGLVGGDGMGHGAHGGSHEAVLLRLRAIAEGTNGDDEIEGGAEDDAINGRFGDDTILGGAGDDVLQGYYGNDVLLGGAGNDVLDGGHGEDVLDGGDGDDLLIAQADGREPEIYPDPDRDEGDPAGELTDGKLYPDQPIPADDVLTGGAGADVFYIQTLINAKHRYLREHTNDDGTINWHRVAGENDRLHDHWVDEIGDDVITDFSRAEGDRILIEGHTTQIAGVTYGDADGDGVADHSIVELYSDQGNGGGAHNDDRLGTLTVFGDLIIENDIELDTGPAYGIVNTIDKLNEALKPLAVSEDLGPIAPPADLGGGAPSDFVYFLVDTQTDEVIRQVRSGDAIDIDVIESHPISIVAAPVGQEVGSVRFRYGDKSHTENAAPYAMFGDNRGDFKGDAAFGLGDVTLHVEAFAEERGNGALLAFDSLEFEVVEDAPSSEEPETPSPRPTPVVRDPEDETNGEGDAGGEGEAGGETPPPVVREDVLGGAGDDIMVGDDAAERLDGGAGDDILRGGAGGRRAYRRRWRRHYSRRRGSRHRLRRGRRRHRHRRSRSRHRPGRRRRRHRPRRRRRRHPRRWRRRRCAGRRSRRRHYPRGRRRGYRPRRARRRHPRRRRGRRLPGRRRRIRSVHLLPRRRPRHRERLRRRRGCDRSLRLRLSDGRRSAGGRHRNGDRHASEADRDRCSDFPQGRTRRSGRERLRSLIAAEAARLERPDRHRFRARPARAPGGLFVVRRTCFPITRPWKTRWSDGQPDRIVWWLGHRENERSYGVFPVQLDRETL